jgi:hypothetical protein
VEILSDVLTTSLAEERASSRPVRGAQVGLVPLILTSHYRRHGCYANARTVFDIHNMVGPVRACVCVHVCRMRLQGTLSRELYRYIKFYIAAYMSCAITEHSAHAMSGHTALDWP